MSAALLIRERPRAARRRRAPLRGFDAAVRRGTAAFAYPGIPEERSDARRPWLTGSCAALLHAGAVGLLMLLAGLAPAIREELSIPVQLLRDAEPPQPTRSEPEAEPAPAPRALAERRLPTFSSQIQGVTPQIVNASVIAGAAPEVAAKALELGSVGAVHAPSATPNAAVRVERVQQIQSIAAARASAVDVASAVAPAVKGPSVVDTAAGASVGPKTVASAVSAATLGSATFEIGGVGASVREGAVTGRDVQGAPDGAPIASVDTAVGDAYLRGPGGGSGDGVAARSPDAQRSCLQRPEVGRYLELVKQRTVALWRLPTAVPDSRVVLRFQLDVAGSPSRIQIVRADDNALGVSAIDAMRAAAPFPPLPEPARCIADLPITGTFRTFADGNAG
jgi:TonB family protein